MDTTYKVFIQYPDGEELLFSEIEKVEVSDHVVLLTKKTDYTIIPLPSIKRVDVRVVES